MAKRDKLSAAQEKAVDFIRSGTARQMGELGQELGKLLAELTAELMDAKQEAIHWKNSFQVMQTEFKIAVGIMLRTRDAHRLTITRQDLADMPANTELYCDDHEPGTRVYELRTRALVNGNAIAQDVGRIIRTQ